MAFPLISTHRDFRVFGVVRGLIPLSARSVGPCLRGMGILARAFPNPIRYQNPILFFLVGLGFISWIFGFSLAFPLISLSASLSGRSLGGDGSLGGGGMQLAAATCPVEV